MGVCAVINCPSGRYADRKRRKLQQIRPVSLFNVPKCIIKRQKWMESLSQHLGVKEYVCELHFRDKDIKKDNKYIINGKATTLAKERWTLIRDAVPVLLPKSEMINCDMSEHQQLLQQPPEQQQQLEHQKSEQQQQLEQQQLKQQPQLKQKIELEQKLKVCYEATENSVNQPNNRLTISDIKRHFKFMPEQWCYISGPKGISFIYIDRFTMQEKLRFRLDANLFVTVTYSGGQEVPSSRRITSIQELEKYFLVAKNYTACTGTGMDTRHHSRCAGFINEDDEYKRRLLFPRCKPCRAFRHQLQKNEKKERARTNL